MSERRLHTLKEFQLDPQAVLDRLKTSGQVEVLTVDGEAKAVMVSPAQFDAMEREIELARDVEAMRTSLQQIKDGQCQTAESFFAQLHQELLDRQAKGNAS